MRTPTELDLQHLATELKDQQKPEAPPPRLGRAKPQQREELATRIQSLETKLKRLEAKIQAMEHEEAGEDRKGKAKQERAAKERDKPKSAAEKAELKHAQERKIQTKEASEKSGSKTELVSQLRTLATKVKGQIAVAKQKLAAL